MLLHLHTQELLRWQPPLCVPGEGDVLAHSALPPTPALLGASGAELSLDISIAVRAFLMAFRCTVEVTERIAANRLAPPEDMGRQVRHVIPCKWQVRCHTL